MLVAPIPRNYLEALKALANALGMYYRVAGSGGGEGRVYPTASPAVSTPLCVAIATDPSVNSNACMYACLRMLARDA